MSEKDAIRTDDTELALTSFNLAAAAHAYWQVEPQLPGTVEELRIYMNSFLTWFLNMHCPEAESKLYTTAKWTSLTQNQQLYLTNLTSQGIEDIVIKNVPLATSKEDENPFADEGVDLCSGLDGPDVQSFEDDESFTSFRFCSKEALKASHDAENVRHDGPRIILSQFAKLAMDRHLIVPSNTMVEGFGFLNNIHANFVDVLDDIESQLRAQAITHRPVHFRPVLLVGPPGIGKTHLAKKIASFLALDMRVFSFAGATDNIKLRGTSPHYANSQPGAIAKFMCETVMGNPIVVLDEIDKCHISQSGQSVVEDALLSLLEKETSSAYEDDYLCIGIDLSNVSFIATANDINNMSAAILTRFDVYHIAPPDEVAMRYMIKQLHREVIDENHFNVLDDDLENDIVDRLYNANLSLREMRRALFKAQCRALARFNVTADGNMRLDDYILVDIAPKRSIGFTAIL